MMIDQPSSKNLIRITVYFIIFLGDLPLSSAQQRIEWFSGKIEFDLPKGFSIDLTEELRIRNYVPAYLHQANTDIGLNYKINKHFEAGIAYRYARKREKNNYHYPCHRFSIDGTFKYKLGRVNFSYKLKYQIQNNTHTEDYLDEITGLRLRNKLKLSYNLKNTPVEPYLYYENFFPLNKYKDIWIEKNRVSLGIKIPINKMNKIEVGSILDCERSNLKTTIFSLGYVYSLN